MSTLKTDRFLRTCDCGRKVAIQCGPCLDKDVSAWVEKNVEFAEAGCWQHLSNRKGVASHYCWRFRIKGYGWRYSVVEDSNHAHRDVYEQIMKGFPVHSSDTLMSGK